MTELDRAPTEAELNILGVLWRIGPSTVRQVLDELRTERDLGYTTVLKMLQVMHDKGLVARDTSQRSHVYRTVHSRTQVQGRLVDDLVSRAFGGSATRLVMRALAEHPTDAGELAEIRALLDRLEDR